MKQILSPRISFSFADLVFLFFIATLIYAIISLGNRWILNFHPVTEIDLSLSALPYYTLLSGTRGIIAYLVSLGFSLIVGWITAKFSQVEKWVLPLLDVLQSIPVLGFLPGLLLG